MLDKLVTGWLSSSTVDTAEAGEGPVDVEVTHRGQRVPVKLLPPSEGGAGRHIVSFTPLSTGVYSISVSFAGIQVNGGSTGVEAI